MNSLVNNRNYCLDFVKLIACIFIVLRHVIILGDVGHMLITLTRCFVPFFFMVPGYYCFHGNGIDEKSIKPKIIHIAKITLAACVLYIVVMFVGVFRYNEQTNVTLGSLPFDILKLVFLNHPFFIPEFVWFLFAMLYVYLLYAVVKKFNLYRLGYISIPVLFFAFIFMTRGLEIFGTTIPNFYYRNFLIEALPFFMLGHFIHKYEEKIKISNLILWVILVASSILVMVEAYITGTEFDLNVMSFAQVIAIFLLAVKNPNFGKGVLANLGRDLSMYVYIVHIAVRRVVWAAYSILDWESDFHWDIMPVLVIAGSLVVSFVSFHIVKFVGNKRRKAAENE